MDFHNKYEKFPGRMWTPKRRLAPLINWAVWFSLIVTALYYIASVNWVSFFSVLFVLLTGKSLIDKLASADVIGR